MVESYIDIHTHILPGVDDGSKELDQSIRMLHIMKENNIAAAIATPHYIPGGRNKSVEKRQECIQMLKEYIESHNLGIDLYLGNEIYYRNGVQELIEEGEICTLAGSSYVLVEFNPLQHYQYIRDGLYNLLAGGYRPILAHGERYDELMKDKKHLQELKQMGVCIQVNAESVTGKYGRRPKKDAAYMLKNDLVDFVATDAHSDQDRAPHLQEAAQYIERKWGLPKVNRLLYENPKKILDNGYL